MDGETIFGIPIEKDENGKIFGMDEANFWAGYAEFASEKEYADKYGYTVPDDENDVKLSLGDRFLLDVLSPGIKQAECAPKMLNPAGVERAKTMYWHLSKIFNGSDVKINANLFDPGVFGDAGFELCSKKIVITKENMQRFLNVLFLSESVDIWATSDATCKVSISVKDYWTILGGEYDDKHV